MLLWLLENSLLAFALGLLVLPLAWLCRRRPSIGHALWLLVLLRLVLPPLPLPSWTGLNASELLPGSIERRSLSRDDCWHFASGMRHRYEFGGSWLYFALNGPADWYWVASGPLLGTHAEMRAFESQRPSDLVYVGPRGSARPAWLPSLRNEGDLRPQPPADEGDPRVADVVLEEVEIAEEPLHLWQGTLAPRGVRGGLAGAMTDDLGLLSRGRLWSMLSGPVLTALIWIFWTGLLLSLWTELRGLWRLHRRGRRGFAPEPELARRAEALAERLGVRLPELRMVPGLPSPLAYGLGRTRVLLPSQHDPEILEAMLAHELAHIARRSHLRAWLELLIGLVHWWNPMYWFARSRLRQYGELACDARVLRELPGTAERYAAALAVAQPGTDWDSHATPVLSATGGQRTALQRRRTTIMNERLDTGLGALGAGLLPLVLVLSLPPLLEARPQDAAERATPRPAAEVLSAEELAALRQQRQRQLGGIYYANRDWANVVEVYRHYSAEDPMQQGEATHRLAVGLLGLGRWQEAIPVIEEQLRRHYGSNFAYYNLAFAHMLAKRPAKAWDALEKAVAHGFSRWKFMDMDPDLEPLRNEATGDPERFARLVGAARKLSELREKIELELRSNDWRAALPLLQQSAKLSPDCGRCVAYLGFAYLQNGRLDEAEASFERQLEIGYKPGDAKVALASVELARGDRDAALALLSQGLEAGFAQPKELIQRREFRALQGDPRFQALVAPALASEKLERQIELYEEFRDWERILELLSDPGRQGKLTKRERSWMLGRMTEATLQLGRIDEAEKHVRARIALGREPAAVLFDLARISGLRERKEEAIELLGLAIELGFADPKRLYTDLGLRSLQKDERFGQLVHAASDRMVLERFGAPDWEYLLEVNSKLVQEDPRAGEGWHKKGWAHLRLGQHVEAREAFRKQDALGHSSRTARYNIACSYAMTGRVDEAFEWLEKAVEAGFLDPKHIEGDPDLQPLHSDERWAPLIERVRKLNALKPPIPMPNGGWKKKQPIGR